MNILEEIIQFKKSEIAALKAEHSIHELESSVFFKRNGLSLAKSLREGRKPGIIAEFKRKSPSKGIINTEADVYDVTAGYTDNGASALSILTDNHFFGGCNNDLIEARGNDIPILRKDFVIDEFQVIEAKSIGADLILLIAACLTAKQVRDLAKLANDLSLEVLLELHDENEIDHICDETNLIGVNNRDLKTFSVNTDRSLELAEKIPSGKLRIAESGIRSVDDIILFKQNGFDGFLIGELFMKEPDPAIAFAEFINALQLIPPHAEGF